MQEQSGQLERAGPQTSCGGYPHARSYSSGRLRRRRTAPVQNPNEAEEPS
jgi:hypothetical protein